MDSLFYYICQPSVQMKASFQPQAEVISEAFFSEQIKIIEKKGDWLKIETLIDDYQGWIEKAKICGRKEPFPKKSPIAFVNRLAAHLYRHEETIYGPLLTLPYESRLEIIDPLIDANSRWIKVQLPDQTEAFIQRGDVLINPPYLSKKEIVDLSLYFLNLPYTWGGRSSFGYDCSGFIQMLYRRMNIELPRDSKCQFTWKGFLAIKLSVLNAGDLIFFGHSENEIKHVGLALDNQSFIHAVATTENAPYIRISKLTDEAWNGTGYYSYCSARTLS